MNDEQQHRTQRRTTSLDERLAGDPALKERIHQIADLRDRLIAQGCSMDEVEAQVVGQIRLLGQELLSGIGQAKADQVAQQRLQGTGGLSRDAKKK